MHIGILQFEIAIDGSTNLKDKRRVVRSIKDRLHREHMVGVAEVDHLEIWNRAGLGLVCCSREGGYLQGVLESIVRKLEQHPEARLETYSMDVVQSSYVTAGAEGEDGEPLWTEAERRDAELVDLDEMMGEEISETAGEASKPDNADSVKPGTRITKRAGIEASSASSTATPKPISDPGSKA